MNLAVLCGDFRQFIFLLSVGSFKKKKDTKEHQRTSLATNMKIELITSNIGHLPGGFVTEPTISLSFVQLLGWCVCRHVMCER